MLFSGMILLILLLLPALCARGHVNFQPAIRLEILEYRYFVLLNVVLLGGGLALSLLWCGGHWMALLGWGWQPMFIVLGLGLVLLSLVSIAMMMQPGYAMLVPALLWSGLSLSGVVALLYQLSHVVLPLPGAVFLAIAYCLAVIFFFIHHVVALHGHLLLNQQRVYDFSS